MIFGPGMIVWSVWAGIVLLRGSRVTTTQHSLIAPIPPKVAI